MEPMSPALSMKRRKRGGGGGSVKLSICVHLIQNRNSREREDTRKEVRRIV